MIEAQTLAGHVRRPVPDVPWGAEAARTDVWPTPAQEQLLQAALIHDERAVDAWRRVRPLVDVAALDGSTMALLPRLGKNLEALGVEDELFGMFKGVHRYMWARSQSLLAPMMPIVEELERAGIQTLLLKGGAFVADGRLDAGVRALNDLDVLVPEDLRREAIDVLLGAGLTPEEGVPVWYVTDYVPRYSPGYGFRDEADHGLDLHWHAMHISCQRGADEDLWEAALPIELLGTSSRTLCPADELLLVILHGLRWNELPTYRWVVDAAGLCEGALGEVDYDRLVEQARKRQVTIALRLGLEYLRRAVLAPVPPQTIRALRPLRPALLERLELRALCTQRRARSVLQEQIVYHQQQVRHELPFGTRPTLARHLAFARERLGIRRLGDLRAIPAGGRPGPGRPYSEMAAAIGTGRPGPGASPLTPGEPLDLGCAEAVREYVCYGTYLPEGTGCLTAGRQTLLELPLCEPARTSLILELSADPLPNRDDAGRRVEVALGGRRLAAIAMAEGDGLRREGIVLPFDLIAGRDRLELTLDVAGATSPARLGVADDDRRMGIFLRELVLRVPRRAALEEELLTGEGGEEGIYAGGWGLPEPTGRWTVGESAQVLLAVDGPVWPAELEFEAIPFIGAGGRGLLVEVSVNGAPAGSVEYEREEPLSARVPVPAAAQAGGGELLLGWRIRDPSSPHAEGLSADRRMLGLFVRRLVLRGG